MALTVGSMTQDELRQMISGIVEEKLTEIVGDPDEGLPIQQSLRRRLLRQKKAVSRGLRGELLEEVAQRLIGP